MDKGVNKRTLYNWLAKCNFSFSKYHKGEFKDGALNEEVLDHLFGTCLPKFVSMREQGLLLPEDFDGIKDEVNGKSLQAYAKAKARAVAYAKAHPESDFGSNPDEALPILLWSHDEACASSMDTQSTGWLKNGLGKIQSKCNSGAKVMAAEFVSIWGTGWCALSNEEFVKATTREDDPYKGPQRSLVLFEVCNEGTRDEAYAAAQAEVIEGACGPETEADPAARAQSKLLTLTVTKLKSFLTKFKALFAKSAKKAGLQEKLGEWLRDHEDDRDLFLTDVDSSVSQTIHKGYFRNEHVDAQLKGTMRLIEEKTVHGDMPPFKHVFNYDNAPSHKKRSGDGLHLPNIKQKDGYKGPAKRSTTFPADAGDFKKGDVQSMTTTDGENKGLLTVGFERGYWDKDGKVAGGTKKLSLEDMSQQLSKDPDFKYCPTIIEDTVKDFNDRRVAEGRTCEFEVAVLSKFWCTLAFIEQYWNDVKQVTRERCDLTMPTLKAVFPVALATACPVTQIRKYMRRSLDHVDALLELGRHGDFDKIPALRKKYKSHRRAELIRLGLESEEKRRARGNWGSLERARRVFHQMTQEELVAAEVKFDEEKAAALKREEDAAAEAAGRLEADEAVYNAELLRMRRRAAAACAAAAAAAATTEEAWEEEQGGDEEEEVEMPIRARRIRVASTAGDGTPIGTTR